MFCPVDGCELDVTDTTYIGHIERTVYAECRECYRRFEIVTSKKRLDGSFNLYRINAFCG